MGNDRKEQGQAIELSADEWTAYQFSSPARDKYGLSLQIKAMQQPAVIRVQTDGKSMELKIPETDWTPRVLKPQIFRKGPHEMKIMVKSGSIRLDWINCYKIRVISH